MTSWPYYAEDEIAAVVAVLRSGKVNYWTGEQIPAFEREFAQICGRKFAVALANGTVALELALHVLGIGEGDDVIVTPRSFIASASCPMLQGARPVFAEVDRDSQNITAETIRAALTPRTRAIIAVHLAGWSCDMDPLLALARERGLFVIEDCAQAHGARYKGRPVGSLGDVATFSFCQDKIITTGGEGGLLATDSEELWARAWAYKEHGKSYDAGFRRQHPPGFRWLHESVGTNWRMTEMQAAIGRAQLPKLRDWVAVRRRNAALLNERFGTLSALRVTEPPEAIDHAYYKHYVFVRPEGLKRDWSRDRILSELAAAGLPSLSGSCSEIYLEKTFDGPGLRPETRLPIAQELGGTSLMFPVHPTLDEAVMRTTAEGVARVVERASL
jgi:dTDP-4-amino-4,6-dideoxygalactose transaminase